MKNFLKQNSSLGINLAILFLIFATAYVVVVSILENFEYKWNWSVPLRYFVSIDDNDEVKVGLLLEGFLMTLRIAFWGTIFSSIFGLIIGLMSASRFVAIKLFGATIVECVRNMPPLVFIFVMYFFVSSQIVSPKFISLLTDFVADKPVLIFLLGPPDLIENFLSGLLTIALYEAAFIAEIFRGGIQSIERGQWESSFALGLTRWKTMRFIILPQAIKRVIPPYTNQLISLVKDSSIISVISVQELTFTGIEVATTTGRLFETLILIAFMYLIICYPASLLLRRLERKKY